MGSESIGHEAEVCQKDDRNRSCKRSQDLRQHLPTVQIYFAWEFQPLNIFILYLVDFFANFGIDLCNNDLKYSSETSAKRDSAAIVLVFKAGAFRY